MHFKTCGRLTARIVLRQACLGSATRHFGVVKNSSPPVVIELSTRSSRTFKRSFGTSLPLYANNKKKQKKTLSSTHSNNSKQKTAFTEAPSAPPGTKGRLTNNKKLEQDNTAKSQISPKSTTPSTSEDGSVSQTITTKKDLGLDPKTASSGLSGLRDSRVDVERLLNFMSDDNVFPPHPKWKPSTRDRIKESGERVWKEDLEIESLLPFTSYSEVEGAAHRSTKKEKEREIIEQEDIDALDKTLKASRNAHIRYNDEKFRLRKSLEYSHTVYHSPNPRTMDRGNFFTPVYRDTPWGSRETKDSDMAKEYVILTPSQKIIPTKKRPFNQEKSPEDLFNILSQISNPDKYIKAISNLEKNGWSVIGGGGPGDLIVFERQFDKKKRANRFIIKLACGLSISVGSLVLIFLIIGQPLSRDTVNPVQTDSLELSAPEESSKNI